MGLRILFLWAPLVEGPAGEEQRGFDDFCKFGLLDLQPVPARSWGRSQEAISLRSWLSLLSEQLFPWRGMTVKSTGLGAWLLIVQLHLCPRLCPRHLLSTVQAVVRLPPG